MVVVKTFVVSEFHCIHLLFMYCVNHMKLMHGIHELITVVTCVFDMTFV